VQATTELASIRLKPMVGQCINSIVRAFPVEAILELPSFLSFYLSIFLHLGRLIPLFIMFAPFIVFLYLSSVTSSVAPLARKGNRNNAPWSASRFRSLITFGDSYTDENRLLYFFLQGNTAPPPGTLLPESYLTSSGGRNWPRYIVQYTGEEVGGKFEPSLELYNYAVGGAVCSAEITPKYGT
jgi:hypothetical protein